MRFFLKSFLLLTILATTTLSSAAEMEKPQTMNIPVKEMITLVDLGAKSCIPCKLMAPILEELEKEYKGRAAVIFIDVWENRDKAKEFKVVTIPTQIFYDKQGQEVYRHIGFFDKESIKEKLDALIAE
ncbi:thioredoxin family protein [Thermodesulfobacteriota bacterium]